MKLFKDPEDLQDYVEENMDVYADARDHMERLAALLDECGNGLDSKETLACVGHIVLAIANLIQRIEELENDS